MAGLCEILQSVIRDLLLPEHMSEDRTLSYSALNVGIDIYVGYRGVCSLVTSLQGEMIFYIDAKLMDFATDRASCFNAAANSTCCSAQHLA